MTLRVCHECDGVGLVWEITSCSTSPASVECGLCRGSGKAYPFVEMVSFEHGQDRPVYEWVAA